MEFLMVFLIIILRLTGMNSPGTRHLSRSTITQKGNLPHPLGKILLFQEVDFYSDEGYHVFNVLETFCAYECLSEQVQVLTNASVWTKLRLIKINVWFWGR